MCCRVGTCLFVTNLRVATIIIAVLSLFGNVGVVAFTGWAIKQVRLSMMLLLDAGQSDTLLLSAHRAALALLVVMLLLSIVAVFLDVVLGVAAIRRRRDMVQSWTHGHAVVSGAYLLFFWMLIVGNFANGFILYGFIILIACIIGTVLSLYFWVVVRSFDFKLHQSQLRTVSGDCGPSSDKSPPYTSHA